MATTTVLEKLDQWVSKTPNKIVLNFLDDSGNNSVSHSYLTLDAASRNVARHLIDDHNVARGDCVLLTFPPSLDFIVAFFGCLRAGAIAVPVYPPDPHKVRKDLYAFAAISASSKAKIVLTNSAYNYATKITALKDALRGERNKWPELTWIVTDTIPMKSSKQEMPTITHDDIAFLQYTSGSTSAPKGVILTHGNLSHNLNFITSAMKSDTSTVEVSWLPQYHDMGLIGAYLGLLYCGGTGFYISPRAFVRQPSLWPKLLSKHKATHTQAPSFAFGLTVRKFMAENKSGDISLDLSNLKHIINAAEPIDPLVMDRFISAFTPFGLPEGVIRPTYGLAEHTVCVCTNGSKRVVANKELLEGKKGLLKEVDKLELWAFDVDTSALGGANEGIKISNLVGCGNVSEAAKHSVDIRIVGVMEEEEEYLIPKALPNGHVGEIWIRSPSCAAGYWGLEEKTKEVFGVELMDEGKGFLRTGDLGLIWEDELYVTGRWKDLIIIRGKNHYPQDIERSIENALPDIVRPGCSAAFGVSSGGGPEKLVIQAELRETHEAIGSKEAQDLVHTLRSALSEYHGIVAGTFQFLKARTIPKTTSGKISRTRCRMGYLNGTLEVLHHFSDPAQETVDAMMKEPGLDDIVDRRESDLLGDHSIQVQNRSIPLDQLPERDIDLSSISDKDLLQEVINQVREVIGEVSINHNYKPDTPLISMGFDSMKGLELLGQLEMRFKISVPDEALSDANTSLLDLVQVIRRGGKPCENRYSVYQGKNLVADSTSKDKVASSRIFKGSFHTGKLPPGCLSNFGSDSVSNFRRIEIYLHTLRITCDMYGIASLCIPILCTCSAIFHSYGLFFGIVCTLGIILLMSAFFIWGVPKPNCKVVSDWLDHYGFCLVMPDELVSYLQNSNSKQCLMIGPNHDKLSQTLAKYTLQSLLGKKFTYSYGSAKNELLSGYSVGMDLNESKKDIKEAVRILLSLGLELVPVLPYKKNNRRALLLGMPLKLVRKESMSDEQLNAAAEEALKLIDSSIDHLRGRNFKDLFEGHQA